MRVEASPTLSNSPFSQMSCSRALVLIAIVKRTCGRSNWKFKTDTVSVFWCGVQYSTTVLNMCVLVTLIMQRKEKDKHLIDRMNSRQLSEHGNAKNFRYQMRSEEVRHCLVHMKVRRSGPNFSQQPVILIITGEKDGTVFSRGLTQLVNKRYLNYNYVRIFHVWVNILTIYTYYRFTLLHTQKLMDKCTIS